METNKALVEYLLESGFADYAVAMAMLEVDRRDFVPLGEQDLSYVDTPLPIGMEQTISAPGVIALMLKSLKIKQGMKVLEVGTGSGYQTAIISKLVGESGKVVSLEVVPELCNIAKSNLSKYELKNVDMVCASGAKGYGPEAPYDRIIYSAAARKMPDVIGQLKENGKVIAPIGSSYSQDLRLVEKKDGAVEEKNLGPVIFVPLLG